MTLKSLAKRLNDMVEENEKCGKGERNDLPVYVRTTKSLRLSEWFPIAYASNCKLTVGDTRMIELISEKKGSIEECNGKGFVKK